MAASADVFSHGVRLRKPLIGSFALHGALVLLALFGHLLPSTRGENWGGTETGGGGAMSATLVRSIPIPLTQPAPAENVLANESAGLSQSHPKEVPKVEEPKAIPIPAREAKRKGTHEVATARKEPPKQPPPADDSNRVPFGQGGPVSGPYGSFSSGGAKGGFGFTGGNADFGSRFGWYVDNVRRKVSDNWLKYEIDPRINSAQRVYIYFEITRSGQPANVRVEQSSGIPSLDQSAVRALQRIDTFGPLPPGYSGNYVAVEFWFDYRR